MDELNQHECMCSFIELVQSLVVNKITPIYEKGHMPSDMPPWMSFLHRKVNDISTNENVKLFIIRGLINTQNVFKSYAKFWYAPLIGFLVNCSFSRHQTIDYFTLDLMVLLISWHVVSLPQPSEKKLINRLFENLMKRCYHDNRAILKNNLELLKTMTECWRGLIEVPVEIINSFLKSDDVKKLVTGIQLFGVVVSNNIEHYEYPADVSAVDFAKSLICCMKNASKVIHASSSEVVGMLLNQFEAKNSQDAFAEILSYLFEILRDLDISLFITCVHRVQLNYPPISARCMTKLVFNLPKLYGEFKQMCAESILSSIKLLDDPILKTNAFMEMIEHRESSLQLVCLKMIGELLSKQSDEELIRLLPIVCNFVHHSNAACRYQMILILISVYEMCHLTYTAPKTSTLTIKKMTSETLLKALLDEDQTIRLMAQNFWIEKGNMPTSTIDRMVLILQTMYSPQTEAEYLSYSTNLLLEKTSKSPDYNRLIYENPLIECTFKEYNLTTDWRRRHDVMTPLFVDTLNSFADSSLAPDSAQSMLNFNAVLRATQQQTLQFQPTQEVTTSKAVYNWLTQSSIDTLQTSLTGSFSESQSALMFNVYKKNATNKSATTTTKMTSENEQEVLRLRRRFLKDKSDSHNRFFARKQVFRVFSFPSLNLIRICFKFENNSRSKKRIKKRS
jgi:DNA-dependent protein kinase catalytic subunit